MTARTRGYNIAVSAQPIQIGSRRWDGRALFWLGCAAFVLIGIVWARLSPRALIDFRPTYFSARCMIEGLDPYDPGAMTYAYAAAGQERLRQSASDQLLETRYEYLPSELPFTVFLALLPYAAAEAVWCALIAAGFALAAFVMWKASSRRAPLVAGALLCFLLLNSSSLMVFGNPSSIAVSCCVLAAWSFLEERWASAGVVCMAAALCIKPHTVGFVWLFFLLAGGAYRKRALQTLALVAAVSAVGVVWVSALAPHWMQELHANLLAFTGRGAMNDPGPATGGGRGIHMITDLQTIFSFYRDQPRFYNLASYAVCAPLFLAWMLAVARMRSTAMPGKARVEAWLALAAIAPLSMLPIYHRQYDAKLILLTIPACALLVAAGGRLGRWALALTAPAIVLNADFVWILLIPLLSGAHLGPLSRYFDPLVFPVPLSLLGMGCFYLLVLVRRMRAKRPLAASAS